MPASANPCSARNPSSTGHDGATATSTPTIDEANSDAMMIGVRPSTSVLGPTTSSASPSASVVPDTANAATAGVTPNSPTKSGRRGCAAYSSAKVATPAAKSATMTRRYAVSPGR